MEFHEAANLFPLLEGEAFEAFKADVAVNGQRDPITVWQGKILDGRNRWRACTSLGLVPRVEALDKEDDPVAFVLSRNLHRNHLNESQRALVAARAKEYYAQQARERQRCGGRKGGSAPRARAAESRVVEEVDGAEPKLGANLPQASERAPRVRDEVAEALNVSPRSVDHGSTVLDLGVPELAKLVESGEVSVSAAATVAHLPAPEQRDLAANGPQAVKAKAGEMRERAKSNGERMSPQAVARNDPEVKWEKAVHDVLCLINSVRDAGGFQVLAATWTAEDRIRQADYYQTICDRLQSLITTLRGEPHA